VSSECFAIRGQFEIVDGWFRRCGACTSGCNTIYSQTELFYWQFSHSWISKEVVSFNGLNGVARDLPELYNLPLDVPILSDCVWTQTTNGLALFCGKRVHFSPYIRATRECKYLNSTPKRTQISMYND